jgi:glycine hydroxymethyltransferase
MKRPGALADRHEVWRLSHCLNLQPSENVTSPEVRRLLASDMGHRYSLPINADVHGSYVENAYGGARYLDEMEALGEDVARRVFRCEYASLKPLSGHIAGLTMLLTTCEKGDLFLTLSPDAGGYDGYSRGYVPDMLSLEVDHLPFDPDRWNLRTAEAGEMIRSRRPKLVVLGASFFLFPYDLVPVAEACQEAGAALGYDASHVLGLIAGGRFQRPFEEGCDVVVGSTHKSFFGPQGGLFLTNREEIHRNAQEDMTWRLIDNIHWNRVAALAQALVEAETFGADYAAQVVANSKALAATLDKAGLPLRFKEQGFTECHQILIDQDGMREAYGLTPAGFSSQLEASGLIVDAVGRLGTNEMTRLGAKEGEMRETASLIMDAVEGKDVSDDVRSLRDRLDLAYVFPESA